jgi:hypothetical protein
MNVRNMFNVRLWYFIRSTTLESIKSSIATFKSQKYYKISEIEGVVFQRSSKKPWSHDMWMLANPYVCLVWNSLSIDGWISFISPTKLELFRICKKMALSRPENQFISLDFVWNTWIFFLNVRLSLLNLNIILETFLECVVFYKTQFLSTSICEKPWFSRTHTSIGFQENFLETKIKRVSRNPYEPEGSSIYSPILRIIHTNFFMKHAYWGYVHCIQIIIQ